jgi:hypothetical protein
MSDSLLEVYEKSNIPIICFITFGIFEDEFLLNIKVGLQYKMPLRT